jgi:ABC-type Fe3+-hydroxamate transport system substrate-binding protein
MRRTAHRTHLAGWLLVALTGAACRSGPGRSASGAGGLSTTDDAGRAVALEVPARRIVSLSPASTELLFAIGAGPAVVGRTTWCRYPVAALAVPVVGDGLDPNIEAVAARHPDLVVLYRSPSNESAVAQFTGLGIPTIILRQDLIADVARDAQLLGRLTGHAPAADSIAAALAIVAAAPAPPPRATIAFVVWDNPPMIIGAGSYLDELATLAGARNVFHDIPGASATVSLETLASRNPDLIAVLEDSVSSAPPSFAARPEWRVIPAVRAGRFVHLRGDLFGRPSPRAAEAVATLRALLGAPSR